jgi:hypothetical protein
MWLRDFLPKSIPNARILIYGYDTKLPGSQSEASILELSRRFLESIKTTRRGQAVRSHPTEKQGVKLTGPRKIDLLSSLDIVSEALS